MALRSFLLDWGSFFSCLIFYRVGWIPWTGHQPVARHTQDSTNRTSMPQVGLEPRIPVFERAKTIDASDRVAAVVGMGALYIINMN
jgi:hypothetical protein